MKSIANKEGKDNIPSKDNIENIDMCMQEQVQDLYQGCDSEQSLPEAESMEFFKKAISRSYGEVLPEGVSMFLKDERVAKGRVLFDLGMGVGKFALQAFLEHGNLRKVVGIEFSPTRCKQAFEALHKLHSGSLENKETTLLERRKDRVKIVFKQEKEQKEKERKEKERKEKGQKDNRQKEKRRKDERKKKKGMRELEFRQQDFFECPDIEEADIVVCVTSFYPESVVSLWQLFGRLKAGCILLMYMPITAVYMSEINDTPFYDLGTVDYPTTWSASSKLYLLQKKSANGWHYDFASCSLNKRNSCTSR